MILMEFIKYKVLHSPIQTFENPLVPNFSDKRNFNVAYVWTNHGDLVKVLLEG